MARGGIRIPFVADVRDFLRGTRKISDDLDGMQRDLAETARDSERSAERVERDWEEAGRESARAFDRFARDAEQAYERVERQARESARSADRAMSQGVGESRAFRGALGVLAGEAFQEFTQAWGEAVRSGDPGDAIRELFSNLALIGGAAFGPVGAVGGGVASFFLTNLYDTITGSEQKEKLSSAINSLFDDVEGATELTGAQAAQAFMRGFVEEGQVGAQVQEALGTDTVAEAWAEVGALVETTGLSIDTVTGAVLGQRDAVGLVRDAQGEVDVAIDNTLLLQGEWFTKNREISDQYGGHVDALGDQYGAISDLLGIGELQIEGNAEGLRIDRLRREALAGQKVNLDGSVGPAERTRDYLNGITVPNRSVGVMRDDLSGASESARLVRDRLNELDGKEIKVTIRERLIRTAELAAQLGGPISGDQTDLNP